MKMEGCVYAYVHTWFNDDNNNKKVMSILKN